MISYESNRREKCGGKVIARWQLLLGIMTLATWPVCAQNGSPGPRTEDQPSLMKTLAESGQNDIDDESWNVDGQLTNISNWKTSFPAQYTNLNGSINSLLPGADRSFTGTATVYLGVRLWKGAEAYVVPEVISEVPFDQLRGLAGAIQNFELQ